MQDTIVSLNTGQFDRECNSKKFGDQVASTSNADYLQLLLRQTQHSARDNSEVSPSELEKTSLNNEQDLSLVNNSSNSCNICKLTFNSKSTLYRHKRKSHRKREDNRLLLHPCGICSEKLSSRSAKYRHRRAVHNTGSLQGIVRKDDDIEGANSTFESMKSNLSYDDTEQDYMEYNQFSDDDESNASDMVEVKPEPISTTIIPVYESTVTYSPVIKPTSTRPFMEEHGILNVSNSEPSHSNATDEKCQLPLCAAIFCRAGQHPKEMQVIWSADLEEDIMRSAALNPDRCMVIVQDIDVFRDFEKLQAIRKYKPQMVSIAIIECENTMNLWNVIVFGDNRTILQQLKHKQFNSFSEIEDLLEEDAKSKGMCIVNMMRYKKEGLFNNLPKKLRRKRVICNFDAPN